MFTLLTPGTFRLNITRLGRRLIVVETYRMLLDVAMTLQFRECSATCNVPRNRGLLLVTRTPTCSPLSSSSCYTGNAGTSACSGYAIGDCGTGSGAGEMF